METRQLKYFLDVANCLNFTKAAQQNHIAQTAMSQNIISLENQLGFKLFERNNRNVRLTHMGEAFYHEARNIVRAVKRAEERMVNIAAGVEGAISIGFQGEHENRFLPRLIRAFRTRYPKICLELVQGISGSLEQMLDDDEVDVIFNIHCQGTADDNEEWVIESQVLQLVVPIGHPLADIGRVSRSLLADESMVFLNPTCSENTYNYMIHDSLQSGFIPRVVGYASSVYALLMMVASGIGITVLPESCSNCQQDVVFVPLEEESRLNVVARWKANCGNPSVPLFVSQLKKMFPDTSLGNR